MKMLGRGKGAIVLVGMVLLIQTANATGEAGANEENLAKITDGKKDFESLHDFCSVASNRPSMAQTQELLRRARPDERIGSVRASEMLLMDDIGLIYCNDQELDKRKRLCDEKVSDKDLEHYCDVRFDELIKFCASNLNEVVRKEIDQELSDYLYGEYLVDAKDSSENLESLGADLKKFFTKSRSSYYNNDETPSACIRFDRQFETIKAIVEYSGIDFLQLAKGNGIVKIYEIRELCKAIPKSFRGADQGINPDEV